MIYIYYNTCHVRTYWFLSFYLYINSLCQSLNNLQIHTGIITDSSKITIDDILVILPPWHSLMQEYPNNKVIFINSEPLYAERFGYLQKLVSNKNIIAWLDYTNKNVNLIKTTECTFNAYNAPFLYSPFCESHFKPCGHDKDIDVLFFGSVNKRRSHIRSELLKQNINTLFTHARSDAIYEPISRSKIVIIIHYYDEDYPVDYFRICPLISNRIFFIHEDIQREDKNTVVDKLIYSSYEQIVNKCMFYLSKTQRERDEIAGEIYEHYKNNDYFEHSLRSVVRDCIH